MRLNNGIKYKLMYLPSVMYKQATFILFLSGKMFFYTKLACAKQIHYLNSLITLGPNPRTQYKICVVFPQDGPNGVPLVEVGP